MMQTPNQPQSQLWSVVLAAGAGRRLASLTGGVPKQFWSGAGRPSLLEGTFRRVEPLSPAERIAVVVDRSHVAYVVAQQRRWPAEHVIFQPRDIGTAPGVLLGLTPVVEAGGDPVVLITPSDHGILDANGFMRAVQEASELVEAGADLIMFGAPATSASSDYGWIIPGEILPGPSSAKLRRVEQFVEKPHPEEANELFERGGVWSTMVFVTKASTLLRLYDDHLPALVAVFREYWALPPGVRDEFLARRYLTLPCSDFSRDLLSHVRWLNVYTWPPSLGWSDLGTPERLALWTRHESTKRTPREAYRELLAG